MAGKQLRRHTTWTPAPGMTARQIEKELGRQRVLFEEKCKNGQFMGGSIVQWQVVAVNPCTRVKPPKLEQKTPRYLDEVQAAELLRLIANEDMQYKTMVKLLLYTGLRRGELCGLEWSDIDFEHNTLTVRRSSLYLPERGVFADDTKNKTSQRCMKVPAVAFAMLRDYRHWQTEQRFKVGD